MGHRTSPGEVLELPVHLPIADEESKTSLWWQAFALAKVRKVQTGEWPRPDDPDPVLQEWAKHLEAELARLHNGEPFLEDEMGLTSKRYLAVRKAKYAPPPKRSQVTRHGGETEEIKNLLRAHQPLTTRQKNFLRSQFQNGLLGKSAARECEALGFKF